MRSRATEKHPSLQSSARWVLALLTCVVLFVLILQPVTPASAQIQGANSQQTRAYRKAARKATKDMVKYSKQQQKAMKKAAKAQRKALKRAQQQRGWTGGR